MVRIYAHPTGIPGLRGVDPFGSGAYGASRAGGKRKHKGLDYLVMAEGPIYAPFAGVVSKIGYPYSDNLSFRYIEITSDELSVRLFYISPHDFVKKGVMVFAGEEIGRSQSLQGRYKGITDHCHVELKVNGQIVNPARYLPAFED